MLERNWTFLFQINAGVYHVKYDANTSHFEQIVNKRWYENSETCSDMMDKGQPWGPAPRSGKGYLYLPFLQAALRFTFPSRWKWTTERKKQQSGRWHTAEVFNHSLIQFSSTCCRLSVLWSPRGMSWTEVWTNSSDGLLKTFPCLGNVS